MEDNAAGVNILDELIPAIKNIDCLRQSRLELSAHRSEFGTMKISYLCRTFDPKKIKPKLQKLKKKWSKLQRPSQ